MGIMKNISIDVMNIVHAIKYMIRDQAGDDQELQTIMLDGILQQLSKSRGEKI